MPLAPPETPSGPATVRAQEDHARDAVCNAARELRGCGERAASVEAAHSYGVQGISWPRKHIASCVRRYAPSNDVSRDPAAVARGEGNRVHSPTACAKRHQVRMNIGVPGPVQNPGPRGPSLPSHALGQITTGWHGRCTRSLFRVSTNGNLQRTPASEKVHHEPTSLCRPEGHEPGAPAYLLLHDQLPALQQDGDRARFQPGFLRRGRQRLPGAPAALVHQSGICRAVEEVPVEVRHRRVPPHVQLHRRAAQVPDLQDQRRFPPRLDRDLRQPQRRRIAPQQAAAERGGVHRARQDLLPSRCTARTRACPRCSRSSRWGSRST